MIFPCIFLLLASSIESYHAIPPPPNAVIDSINLISRKNSGNSLSMSFNNSVYNVSWILAGKLNLVNHEIHVISNRLGIVKIVLVQSSCYNNLFDKALSILKSREEISINSINVEVGNYSPVAYGISVFANPWLEGLPYVHVAEVKNYVYESNYYFGTAEVYISSAYPSINLGYPSLLPELVINFVLDLSIISYIIYYLRKREL